MNWVANLFNTTINLSDPSFSFFNYRKGGSKDNTKIITAVEAKIFFWGVYTAYLAPSTSKKEIKDLKKNNSDK